MKIVRSELFVSFELCYVHDHRSDDVLLLDRLGPNHHGRQFASLFLQFWIILELNFSQNRVVVLISLKPKHFLTVHMFFYRDFRSTVNSAFSFLA